MNAKRDLLVISLALATGQAVAADSFGRDSVYAYHRPTTVAMANSGTTSIIQNGRDSVYAFHRSTALARIGGGGAALVAQNGRDSVYAITFTSPLTTALSAKTRSSAGDRG
ncbi:MAG TPA: hypothetical protein VFB54_00710 [Burkholderiales bacterium]|nr:hypothetical protein [Burkholderiales bacterium]